MSARRLDPVDHAAFVGFEFFGCAVQVDDVSILVNAQIVFSNVCLKTREVAHRLHVLAAPALAQRALGNIARALTGAQALPGIHRHDYLRDVKRNRQGCQT